MLLAHFGWRTFQPGVFDPLSIRVVLLVSVGCLTFLAGDLLAERMDRRWPGRRLAPLPVPPVLDLLLVPIPFVTALLLWREALALTTDGPSWPFLRNLRWQLTADGHDYGFLAYLIPVSVFAAWRQLARLEESETSGRDVAGFALVLFGALLAQILMTGRTFVALLFVFLLAYRMIGRRSVLPLFAVCLTAFAAVFWSFSIIMVNGGEPEAPLSSNVTEEASVSEYVAKEAPLSENLARVSGNAFWYAVGGLRAFDRVLNGDVELPIGRATRLVDAIAFRLGASSTPPLALVQPFVEAPFAGNVYTIWGTLWTDLGLLPSLCFVFFAGGVHGVLVRRGERGNRGARYAAALMAYPLLMSFFQDQTLSLASTWIQYALLYALFFGILVPIVRRRTESPQERLA